MDLSTFYDECQLLPDSERQWVDAFYRTVIDVFGEDNQNFTDFHKVCSLFYGKSSSLSKAQYYRKRNLICKLYNWLAAQGAVDEECVQRVYALKLQDVVSDSELYRHYFKSLDDCLSFIDHVGRMQGLGDYDDMLNIKVIAILAWHQVELPEIQVLHKSDLQLRTHAVLVGERTIQLSIEHFNILRRFAELDIHKGFPSHKIQVYLSSPYLMRSARQVSLSSNNIHHAVQRFNSIAVDYGKELSILNLKRNGIFSKVYDIAEDDKTAYVLIQELTGCDAAFAFGYKKFYERWKRLITGGDAN